MSSDPDDAPGAETPSERLARALDAARLAEWSVSLPDGRWLVASGLEAIYGAGAPEGTAAADAMAGNDPAEDARTSTPLTLSVLGRCLHREDVAVVARGYHRLREHGERLELEARIVRTDGEPRWICIEGLVSASVDGRPTRLSGHIRDITELKRLRLANGFLAELAIPLSRLDDYDDVLQQVASEAVPFLADRCIIEFVLPDGTLRRVADSHLPPLAAPQLPPEQPSDRVPDAPLIERIVREQQPLVLLDIGEEEVRGLSATEEQRQELQGFKPCDYIGTPLEIDGRCFGVLAILTRRDGRRFATQELELVERVGERVATALESARLYASLRRSDERKAHFLATLSHELRNPLAAIVAGLDAVRDSIVAPTERATLAMIDRQAEGLMHLMDDLLDVARVDADKFELDLEWVSVTRSIDDALASVGTSIRDKRQRLAYRPPSPDLAVHADRVRLEQVLVNLLLNASRYTPEGGSISLDVSRDGDAVVVDVTDTGIGLDKESRARIFERFEQVHDEGSPSSGGLGLGLSLVNAIVTQHGGTIVAESAGRGLGSRFRLTLPHTRPTGSTRDTASATNGVEAEPLRVLLIDDNHDVTSALGKVFERNGHTIVCEESGEAGANAYRARPAELVLLDIGLPDMDGYDVAERIRAHEREAALAACYLVALTGYGQARDRDKALEAGFDTHVVKPVRLEGLRALAHAAARKKRVGVLAGSGED